MLRFAHRILDAYNAWLMRRAALVVQRLQARTDPILRLDRWH